MSELTKPLSEMTLFELRELFPIILREHNTEYAKWYKEDFPNVILGVPH